MRRHLPRQQAGFTLTELVLVLVLIVILLCMLLPAVARIRGASARAKCANQMRQIVLGAHSCHNGMGFIPRNYDTVDSVTGSTLYFLLPYLESHNLYSSYPGTTGYRQNYKLFICPSDPTAPGIKGAGCYVTNGHLLDPADADPRNSLFGERVQFPDSLPDGAAHTVMFCEKYGACSNWATLYLNPGMPQTAQAAYNASYVANATSGFMPLPASPNPGVLDCARPHCGHFEGITVGMCDGRVIAVGYKVDARVWWQYHSPNDGSKPSLVWP